MAQKGRRNVNLTLREYHEHCDLDDGYCAECDDVTVFGGVEPDAEDRECDACGQSTAMGVELAMVVGLIEITDEES